MDKGFENKKGEKMKKYILFTSLLALTACHSGGGHHHDYDGGVIDPVEPEIAMPDAAQTWNATGTVIADANGGSFSDRFIFNVDEQGNIVSVVQDGRTYNQNGNKNEYVSKEANKTRTMNFATLGKEAGLQYADFGYAQETEKEPNKTERDFYVFTGGREALNMPDVKDAVFTGTAVAYIEADMPGRIANQVSKTDDAKLVVDANGRRELTMNFSKADNPWYDVTYNGGIVLSNGDKVAPEFQVSDSMIQKDTYMANQFYGVNGTASEVTYRVGAEYEDKATGREVDFDAAFGGKRQ